MTMDSAVATTISGGSLISGVTTPVNDPTADLKFIETFLYDINCSHHLQTFIDFNITTINELKYIDKDILVAMGISKIRDRVGIIHKCKNLDKISSHRQHNIEQLNEVINKISMLSTGNTNTITEELVSEKHHVIFILNDGSAKKVNVSGCFNADSIKKRLIKRLPAELVATNSSGEESRSVADYDVFVVDYVKNVLHLLYDVELVTICHSTDRMEKNRLIFISKYQTPGEKAIATSKKLYIKTMSLANHIESRDNDSSQSSSRYTNNTADLLRVDNKPDNIRKIFNQRPPSEYISTNLAGYFPKTDVKKLQKTLRDSYRQSTTLNSSGQMHVNPESNKIGDIFLRHSHAVDTALLQSIQNQPMDIDTKRNSRTRSSKSGQSDLISLYDTESDGDTSSYTTNINSVTSEFDEDIVSLPTKIETPKAWLKGARIGSGSFGSVYLGMNAMTGELMAVKQVSIQPEGLSRSNSGAKNDEKNGGDNKQQPKKNQLHIQKKMVDALQHEMNLLKDLHHENIVTYYGSSQEGNNLNIFLEYVPGGSVSSMLNNYGPFEESLIINFTRQILIGVSYLHRKNIIHRDIKGANILIDIKGCVKITDFGISKKLSPLSNTKTKEPTVNKRASLQGSVYWMAPEVVKQAATTSKVDIWSTGCVVIEMFTGKHPFPDFSQMQAIFKIGTNTSPELPSWATDNAKDFLKQAFELDYKIRPSAIDLLQHTWLDTHII